MNPSTLRASLATLALTLGACAAVSDHQGAAEGTAPLESATAFSAPVTPREPSIMRNVSLIEGGNYQYPYIPSFRTSADGRVALAVKERRDGYLQFFLYAPEKLAAEKLPFGLTKAPLAYPNLLASTTPYSTSGSYGLPENLFGPSDATYQQQHHTICDGTSQFPGAGAKTNPYVCGAGGTFDCYDLTVIAPVHYTDAGGKARSVFYGTPITVKVANPKTTAAAIVDIATGTPVRGTSDALYFTNPLEPMITADGHLFVTRGLGPLTWYDDVQKKTVTDSYNIVYAVGDASADPCDVRQWQTFYPIAHAPYDPKMKGRYGIADYPFRDTEGNEIPEDGDLQGTYPWIDRMGRNLFFENVSATLFVPNKTSTGVLTRYPEHCPSGVTCLPDPSSPADIDKVEGSDDTRGVTMVGRWTHGKEVQLDALFNNIDYGLHTPDVAQRMVDLYKDGAGNTVSVRLGNGRTDGLAASLPDGFSVNSTIMDSLENIFADVPAFKPTALRDVTWRMNMGKGGDEVSFDDFIDADAFIVSEMTASTTYPGGTKYHDGFIAPSSTTDGGFIDDIHLQNAATAVPARWAIPKCGLVAKGSPARVEPAALGGIKGKGFWLEAPTHVDYAISAQPQSIHTNWFLSIFVDSRFPDDAKRRRLFTYPDGTTVDILGRSAIDLSLSGTVVRHIALPFALAERGWSHLAFEIAPLGMHVDTSVNGYLLDSFSTQSHLFQLVPGTLSVGSGFVGWIDELKLLARDPDVETICNHAHGTLVGLDSSSDPTWYARAGLYPATAHRRIGDILASAGRTTYPRYACIHDYSSDAAAPYLGAGSVPDNLPSNVHSIRDAIHFPEGPLQWNAPRPDSSANAFCLSCHVDGAQDSQALGPKALAFDSTTLMQNDRRRQPLQPPRLVFGNLPAGFIDGLYPAKAMQAPKTGIALDQWDYPRP